MNTCDCAPRVKELERKVEDLKAAVDGILTILDKPEDPVAQSYVRFRDRADAAMGRI
jgi:hypothetical protein